MVQQNPHSEPAPKNRGAVLIIAGALIGIVFIIFIWLGMDSEQGLFTPMWLGVAVGVIMIGFGVFRLVRKQGPTEFHGGTNVSD
jgi:hypothetical protein